MNVYEAIEKRYSVRKYKDKPVEDEKLNRVLNAGRMAPSGNNKQEWKFVVVRDTQTRQALSEAADQPFVGQAPVIIAVVGLDPERLMSCDIPSDPVNCAIAVDHMTLAAVAEELGTCWIGHFDQDSCCSILDVPPTAKIIEMLTLGYPDATAPKKQRKELQQVIRYEKFS